MRKATVRIGGLVAVASAALTLASVSPSFASPAAKPAAASQILRAPPTGPQMVSYARQDGKYPDRIWVCGRVSRCLSLCRSARAVHAKRAHGLAQTRRLTLQRRRRSRRLLDQRRILLRDFVHLCDGLVDLTDALALFL